MARALVMTRLYTQHCSIVYIINNTISVQTENQHLVINVTFLLIININYITNTRVLEQLNPPKNNITHRQEH